jgi:hypothetical protein
MYTSSILLLFLWNNVQRPGFPLRDRLQRELNCKLRATVEHVILMQLWAHLAAVWTSALYHNASYTAPGAPAQAAARTSTAEAL